MTTKPISTTNHAATKEAAATEEAAAAEIPIQLPEAPEPEDMNNYKFFHSRGHGLHLATHFGNPESTIVFSEVHLSPSVNSDQEDMLAPDLLIAFNADPTMLDRHYGYAIDQQGKPPDFVLEIASHTTGRRDVTVKRERYAEMGVLEYWRFDHTGGEFARAALAGDRLVNGIYRPIPIELLDDESWQGHSDVLNLNLRWEHGELGWYDPNTGLHITRLEDERARADNAEVRAESERGRADNAEALAEAERGRADNAEALAEAERGRADAERRRADSAAARVRQLEEENRRLRNS